MSFKIIGGELKSNMQNIMCVDDMETLDPSLFQFPVTQIPIFSGQNSNNEAPQRSSQVLAVVELGKQLLLAAKDGEVETVRELMSKGAPFTTDWLGVSPLHLAVQNNHVLTAEVLLRAGISQEARTKVDRTPLHMAAEGGHLESVQLLISHGADVNCKDMLRMTPLHWAVANQNVEVIEALLKAGADPKSLSKFDKTPLSMASEARRHDIVHLLQTTEARHDLTLPVPSEKLDQDTFAATESIAAELGTVGQHDEVTNEIKAEPPGPKKRPRIRVQVESKQVNISGTPLSSKPGTPKHPSPSGAMKAAAMTTETGNIANEDTTINSTMQLLQAHGITMLPTDEPTIVESAMESGQTVVLTEAGKMALNLTRVGGQIVRTSKQGVNASSNAVSTNTMPRKTPVLGSKSRIIKIHPSQLVALGGGRVQLSNQLVMQNSKGPNILKRVAISPPTSLSGINSMNSKVQRIVLATPQQQQQLQQQLNQQVTEYEVPESGSVQTIESLEVDNEREEEEDDLDEPMPTDVETITLQLAAARREAEEFRKKLARKERLAERYLQQLRSVKGVTRTT